MDYGIYVGQQNKSFPFNAEGMSIHCLESGSGCIEKSLALDIAIKQSLGPRGMNFPILPNSRQPTTDQNESQLEAVNTKSHSLIINPSINTTYGPISIDNNDEINISCAKKRKNCVSSSSGPISKEKFKVKINFELLSPAISFPSNATLFCFLNPNKIFFRILDTFGAFVPRQSAMETFKL